MYDIMLLRQLLSVINANIKRNPNPNPHPKPNPNSNPYLNPKKTGLFWRLERLGGGGGPSWPPPLEISAVDRAIAAKICTMVVCDVIYKIVYI